jgi:hypothetical protein
MSDSKTPISIMIGVPSFRGTIMVNTTGSLLRLVGLCNDVGIKVNFVNVDSAEVIRARNTIASHFIRNPEFSHLLFIDDDMGFEADAILDLIRANKDVIGAVCPKRVLDLEKIYAAAQRGESLEYAITEGLSFVTRHLPTEKIEVKEGLIQVAGIGMAVTLIKRQVFQAMIDKELVTGRFRTCTSLRILRSDSRQSDWQHVVRGPCLLRTLACEVWWRDLGADQPQDQPYRHV